MILKNLTIRIGADTSGLTRGLQQASVQIKDVGKSWQDTGRMMSLAITLPMALATQSLLKTAGDFQAQMLRVQALSQATGRQLEALTAQALLMGATTKFTASDAAGALVFMSMAGIQAADSLAALPRVLELAAAGGLDLAQAADIVTNILSGYRTSIEGLGHANDVLVRTFTRTNTSLTQLGEAFKYAAPVAAAAGVQFEEAAAMIGFMGNAGIQGTMAGTSLRGAIARLLAPTDQIKEAMRAAGLEVTEADGSLRSMTDIMRQLVPHANDAGLMMTIFGLRAGPAISAVIGQMQELDQDGRNALENFVMELELSAGTANRVADAFNQGFNGAMYSLQSAVEAAGLSIARAGLLDAMERLTRSASDTFRAFSMLNPTMINFTMRVAALTAALPLLIALIGTIVRGVAGMIAMFTSLTGVLKILVTLLTAITLNADWQKVEASIRGANRAMEESASLTEELTGLISEMANAQDEVRTALEETTLARLRDLAVQAQAARNEARDATQRAGNQGFFEWAAGGGLWGRSSAAREADELRGRADTLTAQYDQLATLWLDTMQAEERAMARREALNRYAAARQQPGFNVDAWRAANPEDFTAITQFGPTGMRRSGVVTMEDIIDPATLGGAPADDRPLPSVVRANTLAALERINTEAPQSSEALARLQEIEDEYLASVERGERINRADVETWVDRRRAIQDEIDARTQWGDASRETERHIETQERLIAAAAEGVDQYRLVSIQLQIMAANEKLTAEQAMALARAQDAVNERTRGAVESMQRMNQFASDVGNAFASAFERAIFAGESLGDVFKSLIKDLIVLIARLLIIEPLARNITSAIQGSMNGSGSGGGGGFNIGSFLSSLFSGFFADGGVIPPGKWGVTGEQGPEAIYGGRTGVTVQPNQGGGGYTDARVYQFQGTGAEIAEFKRVVADLDRSVEGRAYAMMAQQKRRRRF